MKLNRDQVLRIRQQAADGVSVPILAIEYGLSESSIYDVVARRSWRHIPKPRKSLKR